jgi:hypothetical protein
MVVYRLDSVVPTLADRYRLASTPKRRQAAAIACQLAASSTEFSGPDVALAIDALRTGTAPDAALCRRIASLAVGFDEAYLRLAEAENPGDRTEALRLFSKARAASAIAFGLSGEGTQFHEAIYEAIAAVEDPAEIVRRADEALR